MITTTTKRPKFLSRVLLGLAILFGLALAALYFVMDEVEVRIDQATAQAALDANVSDGPVQRFGATLTPRTLDISFSGDGRVGLAADIDLEGLNRTGRLQGDFQSGIRYSDGRFYLDDIAPVEMNVDLDPDTQGELSDMAQLLRDRLARERNAVADEAAKNAMDRVVSRNEARVKDLGANAVQAFFGSIPLYDLRDAGTAGSVARLALSDVRFEQGVAIVTLSPQLAAARIVSFIGMIALMIAWLVLNSPGFLSAVIRRGEDKA
ncbi:MAG: hypothetical protein WBF53_16700 [Litorimonas sp.]